VLHGSFSNFRKIVTRTIPATATVSSMASSRSTSSYKLNINCDEQASTIDWSESFQNHCGWLRKVLRCRIGDAQAVEDCLQEIALAVFRQNNKPTEAEKVPAWLYRLAVRQSVNFHRSSGRRKNLLEAYQNNVGGGSNHNQEPLDWLVHLEQQSLVREAVLNLRAGDREILMLKYTENWSYKQLAMHLGVSNTTIEYRLVRAKKRLRQLLASSTKLEAYS